MKLKYPIIYKTIPTQYAFFIHEDGIVQTKQVATLEGTKKFKTQAEAHNYINNLKEII